MLFLVPSWINFKSDVVVRQLERTLPAKKFENLTLSDVIWILERGGDFEKCVPTSVGWEIAFV